MKGSTEQQADLLLGKALRDQGVCFAWIIVPGDRMYDHESVVVPYG